MTVTVTGLTVRVLRGEDLVPLPDGVAELLESTGAPVTARAPWLQTWIRCYRSWHPWCVVLERDGVVVGAALLADRRRPSHREVTALGTGPSDYLRVPLASASLATPLAAAVRAELDARGRLPWRLRLDQMPIDDPFVSSLCELLPYAQVGPGDGAPTLRFGSSRDVTSYMSTRYHALVRNRAARAARAGMVRTTNTVTDLADLEAVMPELVAVCRARDQALGRSSQVDDPEDASFLHAILRDLAGRGELVLTVVRLNGELAAYAACLVDDGAHRLWNTRFHPRFGRFGVGRAAVTAAIETALADPRAHEFDGMRGEEEYKSAFANHTVPAIRLEAWSHRGLGQAQHAARRALRRLRRLRPRRAGARRDR